MILNTIELEEYISRMVQIIKTNEGEEITLNQCFCEDGTNGIEGTYVFMQNDMYHYLFTEKGRVVFDKTTFFLDEITYLVLDDSIFLYAMNYAKENRNENQDFRRLLFSKELKLHKLLGEYFFQKKKE